MTSIRKEQREERTERATTKLQSDNRADKREQKGKGACYKEREKESVLVSGKNDVREWRRHSCACLRIFSLGILIITDVHTHTNIIQVETSMNGRY